MRGIKMPLPCCAGAKVAALLLRGDRAKSLGSCSLRCPARIWMPHPMAQGPQRWRRWMHRRVTAPGEAVLKVGAHSLFPSSLAIADTLWLA